MQLISQRGSEARWTRLTGEDELSGNQEAQWGPSTLWSCRDRFRQTNTAHAPAVKHTKHTNLTSPARYTRREREELNREHQSELSLWCELIALSVITSWEEIGHLILWWPFSSPFMSFPVTLLLCLSWPFTDSTWTEILLEWPLVTTSSATVGTIHTPSTI